MERGKGRTKRVREEREGRREGRREVYVRRKKAKEEGRREKGEETLVCTLVIILPVCSN